MGNLNNGFSNVTTGKKLSKRVLSLVLALTLVLSMATIGFSASAVGATSISRGEFEAEARLDTVTGRAVADLINVSYYVRSKDEFLELQEVAEPGKQYYANVVVDDAYKLASKDENGIIGEVIRYNSKNETVTATDITFNFFTDVNPYDSNDERDFFVFTLPDKTNSVWADSDEDDYVSVKLGFAVSERKAGEYDIKGTGWYSTPESTDGGETYYEQKFFKANDLVEMENISMMEGIEAGKEVVLYGDAIEFNTEKYDPGKYRYYIEKIVAVGIESGEEYPLTFYPKDNVYKFDMPAEHVKLRYQISTESTINATTLNAIFKPEDVEKYSVSVVEDAENWSKFTLTYTANDGYYFKDMIDVDNSRLDVALIGESLGNANDLRAAYLHFLAEPGDKVTDIKSTTSYGKTYVTGFTCECDLSSKGVGIDNTIYHLFKAMDNNIYILTDEVDVRELGYSIIPDTSLVGGTFETSETIVPFGSDFNATLKLDAGYSYQANSIKVYVVENGMVRCAYNLGDDGSTNTQNFDTAYIVKRGADDKDGNPTWNVRVPVYDGNKVDYELYLNATINENSAKQSDGWKSENGKWQLLRNGVPVTGWVNNAPGWEGQWFYFDPATGYAKSGWDCTVDGWLGKFFYFDPSTCVMRTGWINDGGNAWYFMGRDGVMVTGWQWLSWSGGVNWFYFVPTGQMASNTITPDGYVLDANGVWVR